MIGQLGFYQIQCIDIDSHIVYPVYCLVNGEKCRVVGQNDASQVSNDSSKIATHMVFDIVPGNFGVTFHLAQIGFSQFTTSAVLKHHRACQVTCRNKEVTIRITVEYYFKPESLGEQAKFQYRVDIGNLDIPTLLVMSNCVYFT